MTPILNQALGYQMQLSARERMPRTGIHSGRHGASDPATQTQPQKANYSGKKKRHTRKNNVISDKRTRNTKGLSQTVVGKRHADVHQHR